MFNNNADIKSFYNDAPLYEDDRLERHQIEFDMTWRYLDRYLPATGSILEIGAATGKYTVGLAQRGYRVTAVDISSKLLDMCRANLAKASVEQFVEIIEADARHLDAIHKHDYDAVLLMGPLYHLFTESARKEALQEAFDRLRPGGLIVSAHISRYGIMGNLIRIHPSWIEDHTSVQSHFDNGHIPVDREHSGFRGYFATVEEIEPLHEAVGFETVVLAGIEPGISDDDESYNKLEGKQRELWLDLFFKMSTDRSLIGASRHLLYVGRKN